MRHEISPPHLGVIVLGLTITLITMPLPCQCQYRGAEVSFAIRHLAISDILSISD